MNKYILIWTLGIIYLVSSSCIQLWNKLYVYPELVKSEFIGAFDGKVKFKLNLKTDGYYIMNKAGVYKSFIFFSNGIVHYNTSLDDTISNRLYRTGYCGVYSINGDTVLIKYVGDTNLNGGIIAFKKVFLIIEPNTLKLLCDMAIHNKTGLRDCFESAEGIKDAQEYSMAKFVPLDTLPEPYCWLMEKDWFYKNDQ